jgi:hypothetical protein
MMGISLLTVMQAGTLLLMSGIVNAIIGGGLFALQKKIAAKVLMKTSAGMVIAGILCLAVVAAIGGWGMFNA